MRAVIIEDEIEQIDLLKELLRKYCKGVELVGEAYDGETGVALILSQQPDLVLLDIQLPDCSGFEMLESLDTCKFEVIFISAHDSYGIRAVKCSALDYLLKPLQPLELQQAVRKLSEKNRRIQTAGQINNMISLLKHSGITGKRIALPLMKETRFVSPDEIKWCEAKNNYTMVHMVSGAPLLISRGIFTFEEILIPYNFIRTHQTYLVNSKFIKNLRRRKDYINELELIDGSVIPVSRLRLTAIENALMKKD